jgi:hypothetical protein
MSNYTYDIEESIIINSLKESVKLNVVNAEDNILEHLLGTLEYYMVHGDFQDFVTELFDGKDEESSNVRMIEEYEDGSALFEFDMTAEEREVFTGMGINFGLIKGILGSDSTDDILNWAQLGKEAQEKSALGDDEEYVE